VAASRVPDAVYLEAREHFDEPALGDLTLVVATINAWNRLSIAARDVPGAYRSRLTPAAV
jgi:alkylhydroperoxidase family enzyme